MGRNGGTGMENMGELGKKQMDEFEALCDEFRANNVIPPDKFDTYNVKRGLRNPDGTGVMAGLTLICNVHGYLIADGERIPDEGKLTYRCLRNRGGLHPGKPFWV